MSLHRLTIAVLILGTAVGLALTNPTTNDYLDFIERELGVVLDRMDQRTSNREQQFIRQVLKAQSKNLLESVVRPNTIRRNFGFLSSYATRIGSTQVVVLGIAGRFVPVRGLDEATVQIGRLAF